MARSLCLNTELRNKLAEDRKEKKLTNLHESQISGLPSAAYQRGLSLISEDQTASRTLAAASANLRELNKRNRALKQKHSSNPNPMRTVSLTATPGSKGGPAHRVEVDEAELAGRVRDATELSIRIKQAEAYEATAQQRAAALGGLAIRVVEHLRSAREGGIPISVAPKSGRLLFSKEQNAAVAIKDLRQNIGDKKAELQKLEDRPIAVSERLAAARAKHELNSQRGAPTVATEGEEVGNLTWPDVTSPAGYGSSLVTVRQPDIDAIAAWIASEKIWDHIEAEIIATAAKNEISSKERVTKRRELRAQILGLEREESGLLFAAYAAGTPILPRPDMNPWAFLGLADPEIDNAPESSTTPELEAAE